MTMVRPFEGLLRPPIEWYSSFSCLAGIILLFILSPNFNIDSALMILISILGIIRFKQGYRIFRYQNNLKKMPIYKMNSKELPINKKKLFLGKGFLWTTIHTQRLRDLDLSYNLDYAKSKDFDVGGKPCIHGVGDNKDNNIYLNLIERAGHVSVIGTTGVGKTRFAELLISQDIHRGDVVIVLDPKGDKELLNRIKTEAKNAHRESDVMILHLGFPKESCRYNPIGHFTKVTQVATRITNALPSTGESAAFKEFAWKYVNLVTRALVAMEIKLTYQIIQFYITRLDDLLIHYCETVMTKIDSNYENTIESIIALNTKVNKKTGDIKKPTRRQAIFMYSNQYAENLNQNREIKPDLLSDLVHASYMDKTYYTKITASLSPLLEKLCTGDIAELLSPNENNKNDHRPTLDWLSVIKEKKIVYVGMDAMTDQVVSAAVGNAMLSDLVSKAHQHSAGASSEEEQEIGKSVAGNTTKIHMAVESCGLPIDFDITGGEVHDCKIACDFIARLPLSEYTIADKGYDKEEIRGLIRERNSIPIIPRKINSKTGNADIDWGLYKYRHLVENFFARLKHFRAIATRFDKLKRNYTAVLALACAFLWLPV